MKISAKADGGLKGYGSISRIEVYVIIFYTDEDKFQFP